VTAASSVLTQRVAPGQAAGRSGASFKDEAAGLADGGVGEGAFTDVLDRAERSDAGTSSATELAASATRGNADSSVERTDEIEAENASAETSAITSQSAVAMALASLGYRQDVATATPDLADGSARSQLQATIDRPEDLLAKLLQAPSGEEQLPAHSPAEEVEINPLAQFLDPDDAEAMKASVEQLTVSVRRQETHLALAKPAVAQVAIEQAFSGSLTADAPLLPDMPGKSEPEANSSASTAQPMSIATAARSGAIVAPQMPAAEAQSGKLDLVVSSTGASDSAALAADVAIPALDDTALSGGDGQQHGGAGGEGGAAPTALINSLSSLSAATVNGAASFADSLGIEGSPVEQIATLVRSELTGETAGAEVGGTTTNGTVKVLHIQLNPENLGSVTVRVSLKDDVINLHLEAQRPETAHAIEREREALSAALKQAGYVVDGITAQQADTRSFGRLEAAQSSASLSPSPQSQGDSLQQNSSNPGGGGQRDAQPGPGTNNNGGIIDGRGGLSLERSGALYV